MKFKYLLLLLLTIPATMIKSHAQHFLIDINAIVDTAPMKAAKYVGMMDSLKYVTAMGHKPDTIDFFNAIQDTPAQSTQHAFKDHLSIPLILSDWLLHNADNQTILNTIKAYLKTAKLKDVEKKIFANIADMMMSPKKLIDTQFIIKKSAKLIKELKSKGTIYLVGNWDAESESELLSLLSKEVIPYVDHVLFSHATKFVKPATEAFDAIIKKYNLSPNNCIAIETEPTSVQTAESIGIKAVLLDTNNHKRAYADLAKLGVYL